MYLINSFVICNHSTSCSFEYQSVQILTRIVKRYLHFSQTITMIIAEYILASMFIAENVTATMEKKSIVDFKEMF